MLEAAGPAAKKNFRILYKKAPASIWKRALFF
jgi:hypothetical protein